MEECEMKRTLMTTLILLTVCLSASAGFCDTKKGEKVDGKKEFNEHCAVCHANGGNIVNAQKPLNMKSLKANGVKSAKDIIAKIRKPGPGMTRFDEKTISSKEATAIAEYIMKTFR
jgi:cytochrome c6